MNLVRAGFSISSVLVGTCGPGVISISRRTETLRSLAGEDAKEADAQPRLRTD
ncbi:MAG: hypothetical protein JRN09_02685 [Nitrososphaerota archaeon]|jgi:hypothetical protein|nr:hypothetical protein [Nitrososphaerota archaeon]